MRTLRPREARQLPRLEVAQPGFEPSGSSTPEAMRPRRRPSGGLSASVLGGQALGDQAVP